MENQTQRERREKMYRLIEEQSESGASQQVFCQRQGVNITTFRYWKQKFRRETGGDFLPVVMDGRPSASSGEVVIQYPTGVQLHIKDMPAGLIERFIRLKLV